NGSMKVSGVSESTINSDGNNRTTEDRVSTPDLDGRLQESLRTVSKEVQSATGEKRSTVETYDGGTQLRQRVTTVQKKGPGGEITEEQVEQPNLGNPSDGTKVTGRTKYVVKYASPGTQQPRTNETRHANGTYTVFAVETQKSTRPPAPPAPPKSDAPSPPVKP